MKDIKIITNKAKDAEKNLCVLCFDELKKLYYFTGNPRFFINASVDASLPRNFLKPS